MTDITAGDQLAKKVMDAVVQFRRQIGATMEAVNRDDDRLKSVLFNDVSAAPVDVYVPLIDRQSIVDYLWSQGWRRDVRPADVTER